MFSLLYVEAVLAMLIDTFTFELPKDKEIYWNVSIILYPTIGAQDTKMQLPLRVGLAKV